MCIAVLFIMAKNWTIPRVHELLNRQPNVEYPYNGILLSNIKECITDIATI
jgi:hypothetical protein